MFFYIFFYVQIFFVLMLKVSLKLHWQCMCPMKFLIYAFYILINQKISQNILTVSHVVFTPWKASYKLYLLNLDSCTKITPYITILFALTYMQSSFCLSVESNLHLFGARHSANWPAVNINLTNCFITVGFQSRKGGGGTLDIFGQGCAAGTLIPSPYTRPCSAAF